MSKKRKIHFQIGNYLIDNLKLEFFNDFILFIPMFKNFLRRFTRHLGHACLISLSLNLSYAMAAELPKLETFFANPDIAEVKLSPDGKSLGMLVASKQRVQLVVMDLASNKLKQLAAYTNADIDSFHWVNNQRLVYSTNDNQSTAQDSRFWHGLFAVNSDGSERRTLVNPEYQEESTTGTIIKSRVLRADTYFHEVDRSNLSDDIYVLQPQWSAAYDLKAVQLLRLNTKNGLTTTFNRPGDTKEWLIDYAGMPRLNVTNQEGITAIHYLDPTTQQWRKLSQFKDFIDQGFTPFDFGPDGALYVTSNAGGDTKALFKYNLEKNALEDKPLVSLKGYDFSGSLVFDAVSKQLLGVHYQNDASGTLWLNEDAKKIQQKIDELLPSTINKLSFGRSLQNQTVLVRSYSDVQPQAYFVFDTLAGKLTSIGSTYPQIQVQQMAAQDMVRYQARDGLEIPAYLSLPNGENKKNLPMVVLVHGGPWVRGSSWGWDPEVQFLASRGYAVLQPEFRGSEGFGFKHFKAGWKQWGLAMQDDLADGAKWAIAQGIADPKRICIAGASYGGYATLMGLAKNPELFRCGVNWLGVTDIAMKYESSWNQDASADWQRYGLPVLVGDIVQDAAQLKATSPVNLASQITQPVLLAYGSADRRVPIAHGTKFRDALRPFNQQVEWIEYIGEGHGWVLPKNRFDFWSKVEQFLEKNIGTPEPKS